MQSTEARRVFVSVSPKSPYFTKAWEYPQEIVRIALDTLKARDLATSNDISTSRLIAIERWHRIHIVFDIDNDGYDPTKAHLPHQNDLKVIETYLSGAGGKEKVTVGVANSARESEVNKQIRDLHDWNGNGSQPPFVVDHANGNVPTYPNPRTLIRA